MPGPTPATTTGRGTVGTGPERGHSRRSPATPVGRYPVTRSVPPPTPTSPRPVGCRYTLVDSPRDSGVQPLTRPLLRLPPRPSNPIPSDPVGPETGCSPGSRCRLVWTSSTPVRRSSFTRVPSPRPVDPRYLSLSTVPVSLSRPLPLSPSVALSPISPVRSGLCLFPSVLLSVLLCFSVFRSVFFSLFL